MSHTPETPDSLPQQSADKKNYFGSHAKGSVLRTALAALLGAGIGMGSATMFVSGKISKQYYGIDFDRAVDRALQGKSKEHAVLFERLKALEQQVIISAQTNDKEHEMWLAEYRSIQERLQQLDLRVTLDDLDDAVDIIAPSTVRVQGEVEGLYGEKVTVTGSGTIIVDNLGRKFILTNAHVTENSGVDISGQGNAVYTVTLYNGNDFKEPLTFKASPVILSSGKRAEFQFRGDGTTIQDIALLEIPVDVRLPEGAKGVCLRNILESPLNEGDPVVAIGTPFGNRDSVTHGIISHLARHGDIEPGNIFLQTDTPINGGNSGGILASIRKVRNAKGEVELVVELVGMNTYGYRGGDGVNGSIRVDIIKAALEGWGIPVMTPEEKTVFEKLWKEVEKIREKWRMEWEKRDSEPLPPPFSPGGNPNSSEE